MALEAALEKLCEDLRHLRDRVTELETTVVQDRPSSGEVILVDEVSDAITDMESASRECLDAAETALCALREPFDPNRLRRSLAGSQLRFHSISAGFLSDLLTYEKIGALVGFGREHGREWEAWVRAVRVGFEALRQTLSGIDASYLACWEEIADRLFTAPVSIHTTNIGQNIGTGALDSKGPVEAGIT
jgi:hypothetical protein